MIASDAISLEILRNRLVAVADEAAATLIRTSLFTAVHPQQTIVVQPGDLLVLSTPGRAEYGDPRQRHPWQVHADVQAGVATQDAAEAVYGQTPAAHIPS